MYNSYLYLNQPGIDILESALHEGLRSRAQFLVLHGPGAPL